MKNPFEELQKVSPEDALECDFWFAFFAPRPLPPNATEEQKKAFDEQLSRAEKISDTLAEGYLKKIRS